MRKRQLTKILFFTLIPVILLGATVLTIIITQGGSVTDQGIVNDTGVLRINTEPTNVSYNIYIDGQLAGNLNNKGINIDAGTHTLRIEAVGMIPWEKKITVTKSVVNEIFAKLFPNNMMLSQVTNTNIDKMFFSQNADYVYYVVKDSEFGSDLGIWKLQLSSNSLFFFGNSTNPTKFSELDKTIVDTLNKGTYSLLPSPDNNKLLLTDKISKTAFIIQRPGTNQTSNIISINDKFGFFPEEINWFNDSNSLVIKDKTTLFEYNLTSNITTLIKYSPLQPLTYGLNNSQVVFFDQTAKMIFIYKNQLAQLLELKNITLPTDISSIYLPSDNNRFMVIKTATGYRYVDLEKSSLKEIPLTDAQFIDISPDGLTVLFENKDGSYVTFTVSENLALNSLETKVNKLSINVNSQTDIIKFAPQSAHLLVFQPVSNIIYSMDKDGANPIKLLESKGIEPFFNFDNTASNLIVLLQDETTSTTDQTIPPRANIYKVNLVKQGN